MTKRLLIVDDDSMFIQLLELDLDKRSMIVDLKRAHDGLQAIEAIENAQPHVLVLDLRMPNADGFAVLEHIKERNYGFPVIVLTNYSRPDYREKCSQYGVHEYIVKNEMPLAQIMGKVQEYVEA